MLKLLVITAFLAPPLLTATSFIASSYASSTEPESVQTRLKRAPVIVRGIVGPTEARTDRGPDGRERIYTYVEFTVNEVLKGKVSIANIEFREVGGKLPTGERLNIPGAAQFERGEDLILFLQPRSGSKPQDSESEDFEYDLFGMSQGKINLSLDPQGKEILVGGGVENESKTWTLREFRKVLNVPESGGVKPPQAAVVDVGIFEKDKPERVSELSQPQTSAAAEEKAPKGTRAVVTAFGALLFFLYLLRRVQQKRRKTDA